MAYHVWHSGGGDWLEPFRVFNGLDANLRPLGQPELPAQFPRLPAYRHFIYACGRVAGLHTEELVEVDVKAADPAVLAGPPRR